MRGTCGPMASEGGMRSESERGGHAVVGSRASIGTQKTKQKKQNKTKKNKNKKKANKTM